MSSQRPIIWLALSAFDDPVRMGQALSGLHACDIGIAELGVAGNPYTVGSMQAAIGSGEPTWQQFIPLFAGVQPVPFIPVAGGVVATAGSLMSPVPPIGSGARQYAECLIPPAQRLRLAETIKSGGVLLLANPPTQDKWMKSTRVLLQHSKHPVQSHEIALPFSTVSPGTRLP